MPEVCMKICLNHRLSRFWLASAAGKMSKKNRFEIIKWEEKKKIRERISRRTIIKLS